MRRLTIGLHCAAAFVAISTSAFTISTATAQPARYNLGPDSFPKDGVPKGRVIEAQYTCPEGGYYPGTERTYCIYIPSQYDGSEPAAVMVFNDGGGYVRGNGHSRIPVVFDNLIHEGAMPVTVGVFLNPGVVLQDGTNDLDNPHGNWPLANQSMAAALTFAGYDNKLVMGEGNHSGSHGGSILPDAIRWLWRDWKDGSADVSENN